MPIHFLFPSQALKPTAVDAMFAEQADAVRAAGFTVSAFPESVIDDGRPLRSVPPGATVVYRGWMLTADRYAKLNTAVAAARGAPLTPTAAYLATHHLPNWYPAVRELTPETRVLALDADWEAELRKLGWSAFFVKDYVKSLKTSVGSVVRDPAQIRTVVAEMRRFRGDIEGGLCVRRLEPFDVGTERRYFVLHGRPFAPAGETPPEIVSAVAALIDVPFFSVDVVRRRDGVMRVVEVGDGQVSDLVGWSPADFVSMWREAVRGA